MNPFPSMDRVRASLPPLSVGLVDALGVEARRAKAALYLVGGPVRDILLGRAIRDVDLLVVPGDRAARIARAALPSRGRVVEHGRFGTVRIEAPDVTLDLAGARSETYARPGALPSVQPGSLEEDMARRDFSVNALALALDGGPGSRKLELVDICGGLADLEAGKLRILHRASFDNDPTRMIRGARLAARLGFNLARGTRTALGAALDRAAMDGVSGERLRREFDKLFGDARLGLDPARALGLLARWGVLGALVPGLDWPKSAAAPVRRLGKLILEPAWRSSRLRPWVPGLALWLAPLRPALRRRFLQRIAVRGEAAERIAGFPGDRNRFLARLSRARGRGALDAVLAGTHEEFLHALLASADPAMRRRILRWAAEDRNRRSPLSGQDLAHRGLEGPAIGRVLARIRAAHLDGAIANREEATALAEEWIRRRAGRNPTGRR